MQDVTHLDDVIGERNKKINGYTQLKTQIPENMRFGSVEIATNKENTYDSIIIAV